MLYWESDVTLSETEILNVNGDVQARDIGALESQYDRSTTEQERLVVIVSE
jgi:hypothetical protein